MSELSTVLPLIFIKIEMMLTKSCMLSNCGFATKISMLSIVQVSRRGREKEMNLRYSGHGEMLGVVLIYGGEISLHGSIFDQKDLIHFFRSALSSGLSFGYK